MAGALSGLRVALLATTFNPGGVTSSLRALVGALLELGAVVSAHALESTQGAFAEWLTSNGVQVECLGVRKWTYSLRTSRAVAEMLRRERPTVLNAHCYEPALHACRARKRVHIPYLIITHHDPRIRIHRLIENRIYRNVPDRIVLVSEGLKRLYRSTCGYREDKLFVLPNAVDTDRFAPGPKDQGLMAELGLKDSYPVVGHVGGFGRPKGQALLVRAFAEVLKELPAAKLVLVGDGKHRPHVQSLARRLGIADRVVFAGHRSDVFRFLSVFDIYAHPSWLEADPVAVKEAMAAAKPVISTATLGPASFIESGRTGILVPVGDWRGLAREIVRVARNPALASSLAAEARRYALEELSLPKFRERVAELFAPALEQPENPRA
ncbi:MAG: glycosyltransferase [Armatimonadetes bacterium]|nr:glycosyltransferase [Armatimonadota bacterium]